MATDSHGHVRSSPERIEPERGALAVRNDRSIGGSLDVLEEGLFHSLLVRERRRAQRSGQAFILILLEVVSPNGSAESLSREILVVLTSSLRETDIIGWYQKGRICGVIVTDVALERTSDVKQKLPLKIVAALEKGLGREEIGKIKITTHVFPEDWDGSQPGSIADSRLYPDLQNEIQTRRLSSLAKRAIDILYSALFLILFSPLIGAIALVIKLTSRGPVLFRQERLGLYGIPFTCLKFRTMYTDCDPKIHQDYVKQFIGGKTESGGQPASAPAVYKIKDDPRVTPVGRFLRKTSLDECPQFWNVLKGEMSLVGPRPALSYEFKAYDVWHRRRVLEVKPGITGLWQISGRSRMRFEEMVRLDLKYSKSWSLWLDLKILAATPLAVCSGEGAY